MTTQISKNIRFEDNPQKEQVRNLLHNQVCKAFRKNKKLEGMTFPGLSFKFENRMNESFSNVKFDCYERDSEVFEYGKQNSPSNCNYFNVSGDYIKHLQNMYDFMWLDYCKAPRSESIDEIIDSFMLKLKDKGLMYFTFTLGRIPQHAIKTLKKGYKDFKFFDAEENLRAAIEMYIQRKIKSMKEYSLVFNVMYNKGDRNFLTMATFGISKNLNVETTTKVVTKELF